MSIAAKLSDYLSRAGVPYEVLSHAPTKTSSETAEVAHVTGERVAKAVVLHDERGYVLAVVPSSHRVELDSLQSLLKRRLSLATEGEIAGLFPDCERGAVPALGAAYGLGTVVDDSLKTQPDVYFEAGDHRTLVHVNASDFASLLVDAGYGRFSHHV